MLKRIKENVKKKIYKVRALLIARLCKLFIALLMRTCRIHVEGLEPDEWSM